jgi:hypothetical protein
MKTTFAADGATGKGGMHAVMVGLCLPASSYITDAVIPVESGLMARNA